MAVKANAVAKLTYVSTVVLSLLRYHVDLAFSRLSHSFLFLHHFDALLHAQNIVAYAQHI